MKHIATNADPIMLGLDAEQVWDTELAYLHLKAQDEADSKRTAERRLNTLGFLPEELRQDSLQDERDQLTNQLVLDWAIEQARNRRQRVLFAQLSPLPNGQACLHVNDARGARYWVPLQSAVAEHVQPALIALQQHIGKPIMVFPHGALVGLMRGMDSTSEIHLCPQAYRGYVPAGLLPQWPKSSTTVLSAMPASAHLKKLEALSIHMIREAVAEAKNPVMLFTLCKNSSVMLHLARKAFYPAVPPYPLLHSDTGETLQEMLQYRDVTASECGMKMLVHTAPQASKNNINPYGHSAALTAEIFKTEGLRQVLEHDKFDVVFDSDQGESNHQQPELWNLYNNRKKPGDCLSVYPLSGWSELDIWHYIYQEKIPIAPLYFARPRAVVMRPDMIMLVDDARCELQPGEKIQIRKVRFPNLGCYPLTTAVESEAETLDDILLEIINAQQDRKTDNNKNKINVKKKKQEDYS